MVLTASLLSTVAFDYAAAAENTEETKPISVVQTQETIKMFSDFQLYLKQGNQKVKTMEFNVENEQEMYLVLKEIYKEAPSQATIKSTKLSSKMLQSIYRETKDSYKDPNNTPYSYALVNYKEKLSNKTLNLLDNSTPHGQEKRELQNLIKGFEISTDFLAKKLKGENFEESMLNVSNFIYDNFKYNVKGWNFMTISNMPNQEMACQGISLLSKTIFEKMGYVVEVREGDSHYWITVENDGDLVTFDPTTDIVLKEKHKTIGLSTKDHIEAASTIGFYTALFEKSKYKDVSNYEFKTIEATKFISKKDSPFDSLVKEDKPTKAPTPGKGNIYPYKDIEKHYANNSIKALHELGYLPHFKDENFNPNKIITRGEFSQILAYSLHMIESNVPNNTSFKDLVGHESMKSVEYLKSRGIINGKTFATFEPDSSLTRQQAASILSRTMDEIGLKKEFTNKFNYKDSKKISEYAKKDVEKTTRAGLFQGDESGNFNPNSVLTRGQAAVVIWNLINN